MKIQRRVTNSQNVSAAQQNEYSDSIQHIRAAIDCLGKNAKTDVLARESIANLSVVLFDLKK